MFPLAATVAEIITNIIPKCLQKNTFGIHEGRISSFFQRVVYLLVNYYSKKDDFLPLGFPNNMVHRPQNAFQRMICWVKVCIC